MSSGREVPVSAMASILTSALVNIADQNDKAIGDANFDWAGKHVAAVGPHKYALGGTEAVVLSGPGAVESELQFRESSRKRKTADVAADTFMVNSDPNDDALFG